MNTAYENSGILGYGNSKRKKQRDLLVGKTDTNGQVQSDKELLWDMRADMDAVGKDMENRIERLEQWGASDRDSALLESQKSALFPKNTEERRRRIFVTSPNVVNNAVDEYYNETFRERFKVAREDADKKAFQEYSSYASVSGADPMTALGNMRRKADPIATLDRTLNSDDDGKLNAIAQRYAHYAGLDPESYRRTILEPAIRNKAMEELVDERTPKNKVEYLGRAAWQNSLVGNLSELANAGYSGTNSSTLIDNEALNRYNASRGEKLTAGIGGLLLDSGVFAGMGTVASRLTGVATNAVKNRLVSNMLSKGLAQGMTRATAEQAVKNAMVNNLATGIVQSSMTQGLTLGAYDAAHSVVGDLLYNGNVDVAAAADSFAKGAATGTMLGVVGTPLKAMSRGLTGGRKIAASTGILSAESAVFTAMSELDKVSSGIEVEPIDLVNDFGESAATLLAMRMFHWRPTGRENKLNSMGKLKKELRFSMEEAQELSRAGVSPDKFISDVERMLNISSNNGGKSGRAVREDYIRLMSSDKLSASTRSKLLYIVENKLSSTPPVPVDYKIKKSGDDTYNFVLVDGEGRNIQSFTCHGETEVRNVFYEHLKHLRNNRIANYEGMLLQNYDTQNFFRQAGKYAREKGVEVDAIADAMYRKATKEPLSDAEEGMMNEILQRSNYADNEVGQMLHEIRRDLETRYGLYEGSLLKAMDKSAYMCSENERMALSEYEKMIHNEVRKLHDGTSPQRAQILADASGTFTDMGNEQRKEYEGKEFDKRAIATGKGNNPGSIPTYTEMYGVYSDDIRKPEGWDDSYVWNTRRFKHRPQDVEYMGREAQRLGKMLGCDVELIRNEEEIVNDGTQEYFNQLRSFGWYDEFNDRVVINVPNHANVNDVYRTVIHEVVGHQGFAKLFGDHYEAFLNEVYEKGGPEVRAGIEKYAHQLGGNLPLGVDEYLARLSERTFPTAEQRSILKRLKDFVRNMLRRLNIYNKEISENEIVDLIQLHHSSMIRRENPDVYRRRVFNSFESARRNDGGYKRSNQQAQQHHRTLGEIGAKNLYDIVDVYMDELNEQKLRKRHSYHNIWSKRPDGKWITTISDDFPEVKIIDYIYRTIRVHNPKKAEYYMQIAEKHPSMRSKYEQEFLNEICDIATQYDATAKLGDILYDKILFTAYPGVDELPVVFHPLRNRLSFYDAQNKQMVIDKKGFFDPQFKYDLMNTLEHVIQEREGFGFTPVKRDAYIHERQKNYADACWSIDLLKRFEGIYGPNTDAYRRWFIKVYGIPYYMFKNKYPTFEEYLKDVTVNKWPDGNKDEMFNVSTNVEMLRKMLEGPVDIINQRAERLGNGMTYYGNGGYSSPENSITLQEMEDYKNIEREPLEREIPWPLDNPEYISKNGRISEEERDRMVSEKLKQSKKNRKPLSPAEEKRRKEEKERMMKEMLKQFDILFGDDSDYWNNDMYKMDKSQRSSSYTYKKPKN